MKLTEIHTRYNGQLEFISKMSLPELISHVRRGSKGFSRGVSEYRGVTLNPNGELIILPLQWKPMRSIEQNSMHMIIQHVQPFRISTVLGSSTCDLNPEKDFMNCFYHDIIIAFCIAYSLRLGIASAFLTSDCLC